MLSLLGLSQAALRRLKKKRNLKQRNIAISKTAYVNTFPYMKKISLFRNFPRFSRGQLPEPAQLASNKVNAELVMQR